MKKLFFISFLISSTLSFSQNDEAFLDALVSQKMAELEMQENTEYFYRKIHCESSSQSFTLPNGELCSTKNAYFEVYLFWKEGAHMKFQKFDNCGRFLPFTLSIPKKMARILRDKEALRNETIKSVERDGVDKPSCQTSYKFVLDRHTFEKKFNDIDINESGIKNNHVSHNQSIALIKLESEISELINNFETTGKFFREN